MQLSSVETKSQAYLYKIALVVVLFLAAFFGYSYTMQASNVTTPRALCEAEWAAKIVANKYSGGSPTSMPRDAQYTEDGNLFKFEWRVTENGSATELPCECTGTLNPLEVRALVHGDLNMLY